MKRLHYIFFISVLICSSCHDGISIETYSEIVSSDEYSISIINYHGGITGVSMADDISEKLIINKDKGKIFYSEGQSDSSIEKSLTTAEFVFLKNQLDSIFQNHNSAKVYEGCCMCGNIDYEISNGTSKVLIKPNGVQEYAILKIKKELNLE